MNISTYGENIEWIKPYRDSGFMLFKEEYNELRKNEKYVGRRPYTVMKESPYPYIGGYGILKNKIFYR